MNFSKSLTISFLILSTIFTTSTLLGQETVKTNKLYYNGDILTMAGESPEYAEALVESDGKIIYVGNLEEAKKIAGDNHIDYSLEGQTLIPGFIDGHAHFSNFSTQAIGAQLLPSPDGTADNIPQLIKILKEWNTPENRELTGWIFGTGFDDSVLEEKSFPTKHDLDQVSTEHPIMITHISGHFAVVNSKGLEVLGISSQTENPEGGIIRREPGSSEPNGVLEELAAIPFMFNALVPKTPEAQVKFFDAGQELALSYGYTTAQDGRTMDNDFMLKMAKDGNLKIDVISYVDYTMAGKYLSKNNKKWSYNNHFRFGGMKITLDGSPQGRTAWRTQPYLIPPDGTSKDYKGYPAIPNDEDVIAYYRKALENNWQTMTHANGDAAMDQMIRTLKPLLKEYGNEDRRLVLIHGQYVREDQLDEFSEMKIIASLFPLHTFYWGDWHKQIIGDSLGNYISPTRSALDKGLKVTIHTDAPVALPNLMRVVWTAVERKSRSGEIIGPYERLSAFEALKAITCWSAYQHFEEKTKGTLEKGKLADLVILDKNPLKVTPDKIKEIQVMETIKEGKQLFRQPKF
ncbi:amidohydrolase [Gramella lutea]|uniref:Amidohydrolase n=1 Tax=Christiangramia lutea TaxID=1607951 RepID=A0A9X1V4S0_9FLAO|nr:amidohydrolase [Christiangramia lutea]MCH4823865.1 amidohydrolase [Christiangramia lutea]